MGRVEARGSGGGCREASWSLETVDDQLGPARLLGEVEDDAPGSSGQSRGDGVEPVAEPFRFPTAGFMPGQREHPAPGLQLGGQRDDLAPDPILVEPVQGQVGQAGVFRDPDPVFAAGAATMPQLQLLEGAEGGVGGEGGEPVAVDVIETQLSAGWGRSRRTISRIPVGQPSRLSRPVKSARSAPSRGWLSALRAGTQTQSGTCW